MNIDETRAGDFHLVGDAGKIQRGDDLFGQRARIGFQCLGGAHHAVGLVVAEFRLGCRLDHGRRVRRAGCRQRCLYPFVDQLMNRH